MLALNVSESEACLILQLTMAKSFTVSQHRWHLYGMETRPFLFQL